MTRAHSGTWLLLTSKMQNNFRSFFSLSLSNISILSQRVNIKPALVVVCTCVCVGVYMHIFHNMLAYMSECNSLSIFLFIDRHIYAHILLV